MTICIAEEGERQLIEEVLGRVPTDAHVLVTGVGALNIIRSLRTLPLDEPILNIGYAGSANFEVGSWTRVREVRLNHPNVTYPEPTLLLESLESLESLEGLDNLETLEAVCYTNTDFVLQSDYRDCVFDMELAFICALGFKRVSALKKISDNLSLHAYHELTQGVS